MSVANQPALSGADGAGLRANGVVALKGGDVDGRRMTLRIEQGTGHKARGCAWSPSGFATL